MSRNGQYRYNNMEIYIPDSASGACITQLEDGGRDDADELDRERNCAGGWVLLINDGRYYFSLFFWKVLSRMEFNIKTNGSAINYYHIGEQFRVAALRCYGENEDGFYKLIKGGRICILPSAAVVNAAFSCEMFLKSLVLHHNIQLPRKHDLDILYQKLPHDIQDGIATFCGKTNISGFEAILSKHAKDFVNARYDCVEHNDWYGMTPTFFVSLAFNLSQITKAYLDG